MNSRYNSAMGFMSTKRVWVVALTVASVLLGGCSYQDFRRPLFRNYAADLWYEPDRPMVEEEEERIAIDTEALAAALVRWRTLYPADEMPYVVGTRDVLRITVFPGGQESDSSVMELAVREDGSIRAPLISDVEVQGLTLREIEEKVATLYGDGYYEDPIVVAHVSQYGSQQVYVTGAVSKPGILTLSRNRTSLLEILLLAGGPGPNAGDEVVVTRSAVADGGETAFGDRNPGDNGGDWASEVGSVAESVRISLEELIESSDMSRNIWISAGDVVYVPRIEPARILVFGYVRGPGLYRLPPREKLGVLDAVGLAGGLTAQARSEDTRLLRRTEKGETVYKVDLTRIAAGKEPDTMLMPGDVVIVGTTWPIRGLNAIMGTRGLIPVPASY